jgi:hypothetical protein
VDDHLLDFAFIDSQTEEFEKLALKIPKLTQAGKGRVIGALTGGLLGAGTGAATAEEGQRGAGAIRGALMGGALGVAGGQVATGQGRRQIGRFGQRQAHGVTGYMPGAYKKEKGVMSAFGRGLDPDERLKILRKMKMTLPAEKDVAGIRQARSVLGAKPGEVLEKSEFGRQKLRGVQGSLLTKFLPEKLQRGLAGLGVKRQVAQLEQAEKGLTAMPQFLKGMVLDPKATAKTGLLAAGGLGVGLPAAMSAPQVVQAAREGDPEAFGASLAETGAYALGGGLPMLGSMALGSGARRLGGAPGAFYKRVMGKQPQQSQQLPPQYEGW